MPPLLGSKDNPEPPELPDYWNPGWGPFLDVRDLERKPSYFLQQFIYPSGSVCSFNYFALGLAFAGLIVIGWQHLIINVMLIFVERTVKHNTPFVAKSPGVSGIYSGFAGYILGSAIWGGGSGYLIALGLIGSLWNVGGGFNAFNLFAHFLPVFLGLMISYLTIRLFRIPIRKI